MTLYYRIGQKGQESAHSRDVKTLRIAANQNPSFDTNCASENDAETLVAQGLQANASGSRVVTVTQSPSRLTASEILERASRWTAQWDAYCGKHGIRKNPGGKQGKALKEEAARVEAIIGLKWVELTRDEKLQQVFHSALRQEAIAFTLNFGSKRLNRLAGSKDPIRILYQEISRISKKALGYGLPVAFTFEVAPETDRLHVHGVVLPHDFRPDTIAAVKQVLRQAGGTMHGAKGARQLKLKVFHNAQRWRGYLLKDQDRTVEVLGTEKTTFVSRELTQIARREHNKEQSRMKSRKKRFSA